jgi:hypothetical protein
MRMKESTFWVLLVLVWTFSISCKRPTSQSAEPATSKEKSGMTGDDVATLKKFIDLPFQPQSVHWETSSQPGGNDWGLTVSMAFDSTDFARMMASASKLGVRPTNVPADDVTRWFPARLRNQLKDRVDDGWVKVETLLLEPNLFVAPKKSPAIHGTVLVFESDNFVYLRLYTM